MGTAGRGMPRYLLNIRDERASLIFVSFMTVDRLEAMHVTTCGMHAYPGGGEQFPGEGLSFIKFVNSNNCHLTIQLVGGRWELNNFPTFTPGRTFRWVPPIAIKCHENTTPQNHHATPSDHPG